MDNLTFFTKPAFTGSLIGIVICAVILTVGNYKITSMEKKQLARIAALEKEIEETRPPSDTPETNWQKIMRELGEQQRVFWGQKLILMSNNLPDKTWLTSIRLSGNSANKNSGKSAGSTNNNLTAEGSFYSPDRDVNLDEFGKYLLTCFTDPEFMKNMHWWNVNKINRKDMQQIGFVITSPATGGKP